MNVPDLPVAPLVDKEGKPTAPEMQFRQNLVQSLQTVTSSEGLVPPTQDTANIAIIQDNVTNQGVFTCLPGTLIYNTDTDELKVCIYVAGVPTFKTVTVS
jgi:hypothetical protein